VRGGCTSIGMKKKFKTIIQEDAQKLDKIIVSGGKIGLQLILLPEDLKRAADAEYADIIHR
jgi:Cys-tRNA(Pro)/Cys-tRNA(Cys) deacylase